MVHRANESYTRLPSSAPFLLKVGLVTIVGIVALAVIAAFALDLPATAAACAT